MADKPTRAQWLQLHNWSLPYQQVYTLIIANCELAITLLSCTSQYPVCTGDILLKWELLITVPT